MEDAKRLIDYKRFRTEGKNELKVEVLLRSESFVERKEIGQPIPVTKKEKVEAILESMKIMISDLKATLSKEMIKNRKLEEENTELKRTIDELKLELEMKSS